MLQLLKEKLAVYFRNNWGVKVNLRYWVYWQYCKIFSKPLSFNAKERVAAKKVWQEGCGKIGVVNVSELRSQITKKFEAIPVINGYASLPRSEIITLAEPIFTAIKQIEKSIQAYYKSPFKINWMDVQKIAPGVQPKGSSFSYHIDDSPLSIAKVFIYLTDTYSENGAFRAFNYKWTDKFLKKGLLKSSQPGETRDRCQNIISKKDENELTVIEGVSGTVFIFDNNLAHKGTLPIKGCRVHISMEIMPAAHILTLKDVTEACSRLPQENYNPKPFVAKPASAL